MGTQHSSTHRHDCVANRDGEGSDGGAATRPEFACASRMPPRILCLLWCVFLAAAAAPEAAAAAAQQQLVEVFEVERRTEGTRAHQCANN